MARGVAPGVGTRTGVVTRVVAPAPAVPAGPPFKITSMEGAVTWLKLFVYGGYGAGKTRLAGSCALVPNFRDVLMIDAEAGALTITTVDESEYQEGVQYIDRVRVDTFKQCAKVQEFLKVHCRIRDATDMSPEDKEKKLKELEMRLRPDSDPNAPARRYRSVIMDSLSEIDTFSMYQLLGITDAIALDEETSSPEWAEYKKNYNQVLRMVRAYRDLPMNLIITAASSYVQNEKKQFVWQPALTGKLSKHVQGIMDIVGFLVILSDAGSEVRRMFVKPSEKFDAKCRLGTFKGSHFDDPTVLSILKSVGLEGLH